MHASESGQGSETGGSGTEGRLEAKNRRVITCLYKRFYSQLLIILRSNANKEDSKFRNTRNRRQERERMTRIMAASQMY